MVSSLKNLYDNLLSRILPINYTGDNADYEKYLFLESTVLVGTRKGIYLFNSDIGYVEIIKGWFYGIAVKGRKIYAFEKIGASGRIITFEKNGFSFRNFKVVYSGLSGGIHQLEYNEGCLYICDTYNNSIIKYDFESNKVERFYPFGKLENFQDSLNYKHINSIFFFDNKIYLFLHNKSHKSKIRSQIAILNKKFQLLEVFPVKSENGHNIYTDGSDLYYFDSNGGRLMNGDTQVFNYDSFLRGFAINDKFIFSGGSPFATRDQRDLNEGIVIKYNRQESTYNVFKVPGNVQEIRLIR